MKKFKLYLFTLLSVMIVGIMNVNAGTFSVADEEDLVKALASVKDGDVINIDADIKVSSIISIFGKGEVTINGNNHKVSTDTAKKVFEIKAVEGNLNITFDNIKITNTVVEGRCLDTRTDNIILNVKNSKISTTGSNSQPITIGGYDTDGVELNITDSSAANSGTAGYTIITFVPVDIKIEDSTIEGWTTLYFKPGSEGSTVKVNDSVLKSINVLDGESNSFSLISLEEGDINIEINDTDIISKAEGEALQFLFGSGYLLENETVNVKIFGDSSITLDSKENYENHYTGRNAEGAVMTLNVEFNSNVKSNVEVPEAYLAEGLTVKKIGETYTVGKEHTVTIGTVTAGKVEVDKAKAIVGETITLTLTPNEGFELSKLEVKDADGKVVEVKENTFVMPDAAVTITAVYTKVTITTEIPVIDTKEEVKEVVVGVKEAEKVEEVLLESLKENEELAKEAEDKSVKIVVEIESVKEEEINKEVVVAMKEEAGKTTIAEFFDINILVKDVLNNTNLGNITELTEEIELMILLPEELKKSEEGTTRKYYVVRHHEEEGKEEVKLLEAKVSEDGNHLVFKTDRFSTYALAYEDVAATPDTPQTGDSIGLYIILGLISVAAIGLSLNSLNKRRKFN